jgi:hypothetical protein
MPIAGGGPERRWAEALRRLSSPGKRLDNVADNKFGTPYSKAQVRLDEMQNQIRESLPLCRQQNYSHR